MHSLLFSKLIPGGNPTIILHEPALSPESLALIAGECMSSMHIQAEQVGALYVKERSVPRLEMMGGEFCVNATRAAGMLLARTKTLKALSLTISKEITPVLYDGRVSGWAGELSVSGMSEPAGLFVCNDKESFHLVLKEAGLQSAATRDSLWSFLLAGEPDVFSCSANRKETPSFAPHTPSDEADENTLLPQCYCAARVECAGSFTCSEMQKGVFLVQMPGITHILVDTVHHPFPGLEESTWKKASAVWRKKCDIELEPASGVVWYSRRGDGFQIWPAVAVRASSSEHLETACGSAALALAWREGEEKFHRSAGKVLHGRSGERYNCEIQPFQILQPSGEFLEVFFELAETFPPLPSAAWVCGPVSLVARGSAYFPSL